MKRTQKELEVLVAKSKEVEEAKKYLADTDWYITRQTETGVEVPLEVLAKRKKCREIL